jgi:hypothetical protein
MLSNVFVIETNSFIPFSLYQSLKSSTSGSLSGDFILDTGASTSCIGFDSVSHFTLLSEESEIKAAGAGALDMETKISKNNLLEIGESRLKGIDIILFDLSHVNGALQQVDEKGVHGILGADLLKQLRAVIDYGRNCFYIR